MSSSAKSDNDPPGLAALFLVEFDVKVGYTITWKRSSDSVELDGIVEYKSLPSGLHNIKEDLIYFTHDKYAGLSAFVNGTAGASERHARFVAGGILVPRRDGRLGRPWLHARQLKELAQALVVDTKKTGPLNEYWTRHGSQAGGSTSAQTTDSPFTAAQQRTRVRALSNATTTTPEERTLPPYHPALSILDFLDLFGPLVFTLHREALLRKRLLMVSRPPMRPPCDFVYDISIISTLPLSLASVLQLPSLSMARIRPLFNLGIHDIPQLEKIVASPAWPQTPQRPQTPETLDRDAVAEDEGWVACTSDEILAVKSKLFDILLEMPSISDEVWPKLKLAGSGVELKATQRDLRRFRSLQRVLQPMRKPTRPAGPISSTVLTEHEDDEHVRLLPGRMPSSHSPQDQERPTSDDDQLTEPTSWGELAYSSFIWWASAGEREEAEIEEKQADQQLLGELNDLAAQIEGEHRYTDDDDDDDDDDPQDEAPELSHSSSNHSRRSRRKSSLQNSSALETAVIAYFHRLTKQLFEAACAIIPSHEPRDYADDDTATTASSLAGTADGDRTRARQRRTYLQEDGAAEEEDDNDDAVQIHSAELRRMGLDVWSPGSTTFLEEFADVWFGKRVHVHRMGVECCGVRIC